MFVSNYHSTQRSSSVFAQKTLENLNTNPSQNLVKPENEAVNKILGYGVDKEGFFTSDFNEAAAIPKDFKINTNDIKDLLNSIQFGSSAKDVFFTEINLEKSLNNAYKVFSQLIQSQKDFFSKDDLAKIPKYFRYDTNTFKVDKIYKDETEFLSQENELFKVNAKLDLKTDKDYLSKGEALMSFINSMEGKNAVGNYGFFEGQTTIIAKMGGLDKSMSVDEIKELNDFMKKHSITHSFNDEISRKILLLPMQIQDIDEFKQEWLKLKALNDKLLENEKSNLKELNLNSQENIKSKENSKDEPFTPIQAESKSETFTYDDIAKNFFLNFLENERKKGTDILELLEKLFKVDKNKIDFKV
ncbi:Cj0814 family flagellar-dependent secreted protein [uncultured Campylobacter sp.]|uniref:Cj0814 family flagellar-dependent secreted protein n=1 Tax=uncultured Campylobacter sp. TaxID=218934 RepID=UPI00261BC8EA|nr:hypothetical protein [uncultured Campylobacter sp.]